MSKNKLGKTLYVYNLETDRESKVLSVGHEWIRHLSKDFDVVRVYSTHVGSVKLPANVYIVELGGGSAIKRLIHVYRLLGSLFTIITERENSYVFYHMATRPLFILGGILKIISVPQGLWYAHSVPDIFLKLSSKLPDVIFTPISSAFPLQSSTIKAIGHGIDSSDFKMSEKVEVRQGILAVGRVARIKNVEPLIQAIAELKTNLTIDLVGATYGDPSYLAYLKSISETMKVCVRHSDARPYSELPDLMRKAKYLYTGTPKSLDKVAVEAAMAGCFVLSENHEVLEQIGMLDIWKILDKTPGDIKNQLSNLEKIDLNSQNQLRKKLSESAIRNNDVRSTCSQIAQSLINVKVVLK